HAARHRAAHVGPRLYLLLPARPDRARDHHLIRQERRVDLLARRAPHHGPREGLHRGGPAARRPADRRRGEQEVGAMRRTIYTGTLRGSPHPPALAPRGKATLRSGSGGFTLLEVMIAVAILSITLVTLLSIVTNNVRATNHA